MKLLKVKGHKGKNRFLFIFDNSLEALVIIEDGKINAIDSYIRYTVPPTSNGMNYYYFDEVADMKEDDFSDIETAELVVAMDYINNNFKKIILFI